MNELERLQSLSEVISGEEPSWFALREQTTAALVLVQDDEPQAIDLIEKVVTTGSDRARRESRAEVRSILGEIAEAYTKKGSSWKEDCGHIIGPRMIEELMHTWNIFEMESIYPTGSSHFASARKMGWALQAVGPGELGLTTYPVNYESWRGLAALAASGASNSVHDRSELLRFVVYAGKHSDIKAVLDVARDRETIDADLIEGVIRQSGSSNALKKGAL